MQPFKFGSTWVRWRCALRQHGLVNGLAQDAAPFRLPTRPGARQTDRDSWTWTVASS